MQSCSNWAKIILVRWPKPPEKRFFSTRKISLSLNICERWNYKLRRLAHAMKQALVRSNIPAWHRYSTQLSPRTFLDPSGTYFGRPAGTLKDGLKSVSYPGSATATRQRTPLNFPTATVMSLKSSI
jgi:hypothetical protein